MVNLRRFIEFHRVYLNIFYGIELQCLFFRAYFILKNIHIFWKYRLVSLFISIPIKLVGLLNLCFYNTLLSTGRVDTDIFTFLLVISIFLKSIIIPDFFQRSINILGLHKVYVGQTQSYLFFWFLRIVYWFILFLNFYLLILFLHCSELIYLHFLCGIILHHFRIFVLFLVFIMKLEIYWAQQIHF